MRSYEDWEKEFDRRMRAVDERINANMKAVDERINANMKAVDERIKKQMEQMDKRMEEVQRNIDRQAKEMTQRVIEQRNAEQEWTKRRVFFSKKCLETGEKIKPFSPAYFKDQWDPTGKRHRYWVTEEAMTWKVLKGDEDV